MQQLSGLDALFLRCEHGNNFLHVGPVMIYAPSKTGKGAPAFKTVRRLFEERLCHSEIFRRKLIEVPWMLDNPYWIEDPDFSLKNHVRRSRLRKPGTMSQLLQEIARCHSRPLDRAHPLWMAHVIYGLDDIEGLPSGSFAVYFQIHHAAMDGATGAAMIEAMHDSDQNVAGGTAIDNWEAERGPSSLDLLSRALVNNIRKPFELVGVAGQAVTAVRGIVKGSKENKFSSLGWRERTRFNGPVGSERVVGFVNLSLEEIKAMKQRVPGATVNDVMLTVISGAMRHYLEARGELPEKSLIAGVPVDVRAGQQDTSGNLVSIMAVSLSTGIDDSLERLACVHRQTTESKAWHEAMGSDLVANLTNSLPQYLVALCTKPLLSTGVLGKTPPILNTIISNVPGPRIPVYFGGAKMTMITGLGPCVDGLGLFHTVSSYCDVMTLGFQACPTMLPDPEFYTQCLQDSWDDLSAA